MTGGRRRTAAWLGAAVAGLVLAAGLTTAAATLSGQRVGLSSEPLTAGEALAPSATPRRTATPRPTRTPAPRATRTSRPTPDPTATVAPAPTAPPRPAPTGGSHGGGDDDGGGHGHGGDD